MKVHDTNHVTDLHDLCPRQVHDFVVNLSRTLSWTLSSTFPMHCNGLNFIRATHAARLIFKACRQDQIQPLLRRLHWLRMPERVSFWLAMLVYRCLHGSAPGYLASDLQRVSHLNTRWWLRSSTSSALVASCTVHFTIGDCIIPATAASVWNTLPESGRSSPSLQVFRSRLKTELFARSYRHD